MPQAFLPACGTLFAVYLNYVNLSNFLIQRYVTGGRIDTDAVSTLTASIGVSCFFHGEVTLELTGHTRESAQKTVFHSRRQNIRIGH